MNEVQNFILEDVAIRGAVVRLEETWQRVVAQHAYPPAIRRLLGESIAATVLLSTGLKDAPKISMQLQGAGTVKLLLVQCSGDFKVRGLAQWRRREESEALLGTGRLVVNLDAGGPGRFFQGIVPLVSDDLGTCLEAYFRQSEQLPTRLVLRGSGKRIAGLLLQALPGHGGEEEAFAEAAALAATVSAAELNEWPAARLLGRLFDVYAVRLFEPRDVTHDCRCTPAHLAGVLRMLGSKDLSELLTERGKVDLTCEFCNRTFHYDRAAIDAILGPEPRVLH